MATAKLTKSATRTYVKTKLSTSEVWAKAALLKIFDFQTKDEQRYETTSEYNGVGFTGVDGEILTSFAKQLLLKGWLSPKQMTIVKKKMPKYWMQIIKLSDEEVLKAQVIKSLMTA